MIKSIALAIGVSLSFAASSQELVGRVANNMPCWKTGDVKKQLEENFGEKIFMIGIANDSGVLMTIWYNPKEKTLTVVGNDKRGISCIYGAASDVEVFDISEKM